MYKQNEKKKNIRKLMKNKTSGITLIALVITIIVLLILAGISVMMLTGNNGILIRAGEAKEETEMAQLKEQAETVKYSMLMDKTTNGTGDLSRNELVDGIASDNSFNGSKKSGYKVVTADEKYDVKVKSDLSIIVVKHIDTAGKAIDFAVTEVETESRAVLLKVKATLAGIKTPSELELEQELDPEGTGDTPKLRERILSVYNLLVSEYNMSFSSWSELESAIQQGPQTPSSLFEIENRGSWYTSIYQWIIEMETPRPDIILTCSNGEEIITKDSGEFVITTNGTYTVTAFIEDETYEDYYGEKSLTISKCVNRKDNQVETYTNEVAKADTGKNSKTVRDLENKQVEVPEGFYYGTSDNVGKVSIGFVITDSLDENGNSNGNEFVWIPVDKTTLKVVGADGELTDKEMAVKDGDNYSGLFYTFDGETSNLSNTSSEPALVSSYDNDRQTYLGQIGLDASSFKSALTSDYNAMIESVKKYGGFYVARYEMGVKNGTVVISKLGVKPATPGNEVTKYWYGLYSKAKTYTTNSVQSSMIWGSQYDAMLNFALTGADKLKVMASNNGNHTSSQTKTGAYEGTDSINNIYDLEGNELEWTLEVLNGFRTQRGGRLSFASPPSSRGIRTSRETSIEWGTRVTLYIK